jgi:ABC-type phosphate/phosphonate transport system substrate-binding protein
MEDLRGKRLAFGSRSSVQAGLLAYHFLKEAGINPERDLAACTFVDERQASGSSDERDVMERVRNREYDAGAVSRRMFAVARLVLPDCPRPPFFRVMGGMHESSSGT